LDCRCGTSRRTKVKDADATIVREKGRHQMLADKAAATRNELAAWIFAQTAPIERLAMADGFTQTGFTGIAGQNMTSRPRKRAQAQIANETGTTARSPQSPT
jgi:hypothetical protein